MLQFLEYLNFLFAITPLANSAIPKIIMTELLQNEMWHSGHAAKFNYNETQFINHCQISR